jgi:hypothetical protein
MGSPLTAIVIVHIVCNPSAHPRRRITYLVLRMQNRCRRQAIITLGANATTCRRQAIYILGSILCEAHAHPSAKGMRGGIANGGMRGGIASDMSNNDGGKGGPSLLTLLTSKSLLTLLIF